MRTLSEIPYAAEINDCRALYLREMSEPLANELRIVVEEATAMIDGEAVPVVNKVLSELHLAEKVRPGRRFEIVWEFYVSYSVTEESYALADDQAEEWEGSVFRVYSESKLLDYTRNLTSCTDEFPGPISHYQLICEEQVIDVISTERPKVRELH